MIFWFSKPKIKNNAKQNKQEQLRKTAQIMLNLLNPALNSLFYNKASYWIQA